jgi:hypothetical protein
VSTITGHGRTGGAQPGQDLLPGHRRKDEIQDDEVEIRRSRHLQPFGAVARGSDDEAFGLQPPLDEGRDGGFLLNDQQVHEHPFRPNVPS